MEEELPERFPTVFAACKAYGIDPALQRIPVIAAAHYHMGGIAVDARGRTSVGGLWAGGEVSSTGAHGANRLASNSLLEAVVYAARLAEDINGAALGAPVVLPMEQIVAHNCVMPALSAKNLRTVMSSHVGVIREGEQLAEAVRAFANLERDTGNIALRNMATSTSPDDSGAITKLSARSVGDTVTRLEELVASKGMQLFAAIDQSAEAHQVGLTLRQTVLVLFGSPAAGTPVMEAAPLSALDLPLKILVWDDDGQTKVTYVAPQVLAARYGLAPELAQRLAGIDPLTDALVGS